MAKTLTSNTMSPTRFVVGQGIYEDEVQAVAELLNYAFGYGTVINLLSAITGGQGWGTSGREVRTHGIVFPSSAAGAQTRYEGRIWIDADVDQLHLRSVATMPASNTGEAVITIGGDSTTHSYPANATTVATSTLDTADTGVGWQDFDFTIEHLTGALVCTLDSIRVRTQPITSGLPDPVLE